MNDIIKETVSKWYISRKGFKVDEMDKINLTKRLVLALNKSEEMLPLKQIQRYLDNIKESAKDHIILTLLSNSENKEFIKNQVVEFNKMYPLQ